MVTAPDIPGHKVTGVLGTGGFAAVYRTWQVAVGREVAVKVDNRVLLTERDRRRFIREVTAAGRLSGHPHVIDVYDAGTLGDGRPYLVMELCPAGSLADVVRRHGPMNPAQVRDIGIRIGDALAAAHAAGILHRDIKPANILINRYGMVGLSDFGLASILAGEGEQSATREALTPAFASPESFRGEEPATAADIYCLAATLYALLAGRPPRFPAGNSRPSFAAIMAMHSQPVEDIPGTPPELMALLRGSLATDPAARPPSAAHLRDALAALPARPVAARPAPPPVPDHAASPPAASRYLTATSDPPVPAATAPAFSGRSAPGLSGGPPDRPGSGSAPGGQGIPAASGPPPRRRRPVLLAAGAVAGLMLIGVALLAGSRLAGRGGGTSATGGTTHGTSSAAAPGVFGVPVTVRDCPAAAVPGTGARCPQAPECWNGLVVISGSATASPLPCAAAHVWQTFAIAILPADVTTYDQNLVQANPSVRTVCSVPVLLRSRRGLARRIPAGLWDIQVLPPDEAAFDSGQRAYRCVAHQLTGHDAHVSQFS